MIVDTFAGPGGWDEGLRMIGRTDVIGVEWDAAACATAEAAGHKRIQADVAELDPTMFGKVEGLIASPPCQAWSMAGQKKGERDRTNCHALSDRMADGDDSLDWADWEDERSHLVCQPVRWVRELRPQWVALEEVPAVASLWEHFARIFRGWGYSAWTGDLNSADYGVPQTRTRRILMAHRDMTVAPPEPTHAREVHGVDLFGDELSPWVSMAEALGWGSGRGYHLDRRQTGAPVLNVSEVPAPTITSAMFGKGVAKVWWEDRPATTIVGSFRPDIVAAPGYRTDISRQDAPGSVQVTVAQAGVLQSFPAEYPWQGSRSKQHEQVGNAVPPLLAAHVLAALGVGDIAKAVAA